MSQYDPTVRTLQPEIDLEFNPQGQMFASRETIRAAIFDVVDQGHQCDKGAAECGLFHSWEFEFRVPERDEENLNRSSFVDAVIARIGALQSAPHDGVKLENLCDFHKRRALPVPTSQSCAVCEKERRG